MTVTSNCTSTVKESKNTYHVYAYTRPAASCSYTYFARCVCTGLLPIEPKTRHVHLKKSRERRNVPARVFNTLGKARRVLVCSKFGKGYGINSVGSGVRETICVRIRKCAEEGNSVAA